MPGRLDQSFDLPAQHTIGKQNTGFHGDKGYPHHRELRTISLLGIKELREECGKDQDRLGIANRG